ncbi:hypothetical protein [Chelativorans sp. Marseille-P2723]|uniref:hypothetical protein n=1 Tax=Chelativorans sp. Marseille-P2723 TaxID=2709133 RepID=UPI00156EA5BE|nr:hypothetical protein [Chelativorans sp. Marseille-P2723]
MTRRTQVSLSRRAIAFLGGATALLAAYVGQSTFATAQGVDIEAVFNCSADGPLGPQTPEECATARELVLTNCTGCHTFVPIVKARKDDGAWNATLQSHRARLPEVSDEDYEKLAVFLKAHYNPENEPPQLPPELEALGDIPQ